MLWKLKETSRSTSLPSILHRAVSQVSCVLGDIGRLKPLLRLYSNDYILSDYRIELLCCYVLMTYKKKIKNKNVGINSPKEQTNFHHSIKVEHFNIHKCR